MGSKKRIILIVLCVLTCLTINGFIYWFRYLPSREAYAVNTIMELETAYQVIIDEYQRSSRLIFDHIITTPEFFPLYENANSTDEQVSNSAREDLFIMFSGYYDRLSRINIRQLHFHLPNCDSFLRFHKPEKFGDNLKSVRYSLVKANRDLVGVAGFEEGRIKNGFRYVYPLIHAGKHLGSVEISLNFSAVGDELQKLYGNDYALIVKKSIIDNTSFEDEKSFYQSSQINNEFMVEKGTIDAPIAARINTILSTKNQDELLQGVAFVNRIKVDDERYAIAFLPINDVSGKHIAYIIAYSKDKKSINLLIRFAVDTFLFSSLITLAFISFSIITTKNRKLAEAIEDQCEAMVQLRETESNFKRMFNNAQDAILMMEGAVFVDCNETVVNMLGATSKDEIIGTCPDDISPLTQSDGRNSHEKMNDLIALLNERGVLRFEWMHKKMSGELFQVLVSLTLLEVQGKEQIHVLLHDLTKQKHYEQHLQEIAEQANAASSAKDNFLANMSHEIRTPMNGVLGLARLLQEMALGEEAEELISKLIYSAQSLLGLLNDILDFSKIEAGQLSLDIRNFSLATMLNGVVSSLDFMATEKRLTLVDDSDYSAVPVWVKGDDMRVRQILTNLIGNAIKFTDRGGITVDVTSKIKSEDEISLHFTVTDTGIGIPRSKQQEIFASFTQAESSTARQFGGTGLGLAISKQLVEMMGGEIGCTSRLGVGTVFFFTLTVALGSEEIIATTGPGNSRHNNLHILLAEDNIINQQIAVTVLEQDNHTVDIAGNGLEALSLLSTTDYDLVIMDVQMPKMDGLLATAIIRKCEDAAGDIGLVYNPLETKLVQRLNGRHVPILAMTANAMSGDREKCLSAGMDHYLTKPFMPEDIHIALNKLDLPTRSRRGDDAPGVDFATAGVKWRVASHLRQLYDLDSATADTLVASAHDDIVKLQNQLRVAVEEDNPQLILQLTTAMKGTLLNLGLVEVVDLVDEIIAIYQRDGCIDAQALATLDDKVELFIA